jgi:hypothetical protein
MTLICPYVKDCSLYANWVEQTKKERINIICEGAKYDCLAIIALQDSTSEGGIIASDELVKRINGLESINKALPEDIECSHIRLLNLLNGRK